MGKEVYETPRESKLNKLLVKASKQEDKYEALAYAFLSIAIMMTKDFMRVGAKRVETKNAHINHQMDMAVQSLFKKQNMLFVRLCNGFPYSRLEDGTFIHAMEPHSYATIIAELACHDERLEATRNGEDMEKFKPKTYAQMRAAKLPVDEGLGQDLREMLIENGLLSVIPDNDLVATQILKD